MIEIRPPRSLIMSINKAVVRAGHVERLGPRWHLTAVQPFRSRGGAAQLRKPREPMANAAQPVRNATPPNGTTPPLEVNPFTTWT